MDNLEAAIQSGFEPICRRVRCTCEKQCDDDPIGNCPDTPLDLYRIGSKPDCIAASKLSI